MSMAYTMMIDQIKPYIPAEMESWLREHQKPVAATVGAAAGTFFLIKAVNSYKRRNQLQHKRNEKQKACKQAIKSLSERVEQNQISPQDAERICELSVSELGKKLQRGDLSAKAVLLAYQQKALKVNDKTNAIIDIIQEAEAIASECDSVPDRSNRLLHGIPVSIKDNFPMEGYDSMIGLSSLIGKPYDRDCVLVKVLKHQGAIPFVRTNVPQTTVCFDTTNPIFGQTYNPHGEGRNPGGSSGGEGALIGGGGSPLGLGGDIGGSIRIPAALCGICGFKPTASRLSVRDTNPVFKGQNMIPSSYGPMGRDVDSLVLMMRAILCDYHFQLDKTVPPIPFDEKEFSKTSKLRVGYYLEDGFMISVPAMQRGVKMAVKALRDQGHEVIPWDFPNFGKRGSYFWTKVIFADKGEELLSLSKDDATDHAFRLLKATLTLNRKVFKTLLFILKHLYPRIGSTLPNLLGLDSVAEWQKVVKDILAFRQEVEEDLKSKNIDILIAPGFTMPATPVGTHQFCSGGPSYTTVFNVLNFPAGSIPVTTVNQDDIAQMKDYPTPDPWHQMIKKSMEGSEGLPVGVQVIGLPWEDELTLRMMKELETALKN